MSDLISRQALIEALIQCKGLGRKSCGLVEQIVKEQPTTYDVDKVIKQLKKRRTLEGMSEGNNCCGCGFDALTKAIEIVKAGGVDE